MNANASPPETTAPAMRFGLRFKVLAGLTAFNVAATVLFTVNHHLLEKEHIMSGLRSKLAGEAAAIAVVLPAGYLDRAIAKDGVCSEQYDEAVAILNRYCASVGLRYLYTYVRDTGGFYNTATNNAPGDEPSLYWELYDTAPPEIARAWDTERPVYAAVHDKWGYTYTLFAPMRTAAGTRYIAGADLPIAFVDELLRQSTRQSLYVGAACFVFLLAVSGYVSTRFSRQIAWLAAYTRELARAHFRRVSGSVLRERIQVLPQRRDEVGELASSFLAMEDQLGTYLQQLETETAAKERAQNELRIAGEIQLSMLPHEFPSSARIDFHAAMKPAKEAGGDFYDCRFLDPDHLCFSIGDVSDKGMPAALFMAVALTTLRAKATPELVDAPEEILRLTNELLIPQNQAFQFVTMFLGVLDVRTGVVAYADGGHNRPYHRTRDGVAHMLTLPPREGIALGVMPGAVFRRHTLELQPGEVLFLYTDGVTEALAADETFYREPRLERVLSSLSVTATGAEWISAVNEDVAAFSRGHAQADDITMMAIRIKP